MIPSSLLHGRPGLAHGFFTRRGGVSEGVYGSLNCGLGSNDDPERVAENRRRAVLSLGVPGAPLVTAFQVHSAKVAVVEDPWKAGSRPQLDGLVTRRSGVVLGVLSADCAPILFADAEAGVIGAAHAGWKGARAGVAEATVEAMVGIGARKEHISAAIGPCIQQDSYEVGPEFPGNFLSEDAPFFKPSAREGHHLFDLPGYVAHRLGRLGLGAVEALPFDTMGDEDRFFSYRRTTRRGEPDYGRGLSAIVRS